MTDGQLFTWESLATIGGASLLVFLIVQYTKSIVDRYVPGIPTDIYTIVVSFVVLIIDQIAISHTFLDWRLYVLGLFNSFIVASTASHIYQKSINAPIFNKNKQLSSKAQVDTTDPIALLKNEEQSSS